MSYQILKQKIFEFDKENRNKTVVRRKNMWIKNEGGNGNTLINTDKIQILYMEPYYNGFWKIMADDILNWKRDFIVVE